MSASAQHQHRRITQIGILVSRLQALPTTEHTQQTLNVLRVREQAVIVEVNVAAGARGTGAASEHSDEVGDVLCVWKETIPVEVD